MPYERVWIRFDRENLLRLLSNLVARVSPATLYFFRVPKFCAK